MYIKVVCSKSIKSRLLVLLSKYTLDMVCNEIGPTYFFFLNFWSHLVLLEKIQLKVFFFWTFRFSAVAFQRFRCFLTIKSFFWITFLLDVLKIFGCKFTKHKCWNMLFMLKKKIYLIFNRHFLTKIGNFWVVERQTNQLLQFKRENFFVSLKKNKKKFAAKLLFRFMAYLNKICGLLETKEGILTFTWVGLANYYKKRSIFKDRYYRIPSSVRINISTNN